MQGIRKRWLPVLATGMLAGCAATGDLLTAPEVRLSGVEVSDLDFRRQVFVLGFDVFNPNGFPLPIAGVHYGVDLDGLRFASGNTAGGFTVPARGNTDFSISVELDLLRSAPRLLYAIRDASRGEIPYALSGSLDIDLPLTRPVRFESTGDIRLDTW